MKILLSSVFLLICFTCYGSGRSVTDRINTLQRYVDGGSVGLETESPPQWRTVEVEVGEEVGKEEGEGEEEEDEPASLRESIVQATQRNRSRVQGHGRLPMSPAGRVTSTQLTFLDLVHLYLPNMTKANPQCRRDLTALYTAIAHLETLIQKGEIWPLQLVDSWGKINDGLLVGNMKQLGFFKECLDIKVLQSSPDLQAPQNIPPQHLGVLSRLHVSSQPHNIIRGEGDANQRVSTNLPNLTSEQRLALIQANFSGKYCLVTYTSAKEELASPPPHLRTPAMSTFVPGALSYMAYGTCMPSTCTREELEETVNEALQEAELKVSILDCQVSDPHRPLQATEITGIVLLAALLLLLVLASCADLVTLTEGRQHLRKGPLRFVLAFSVRTNLEKLMNLETRKLPGVIPSIHGIRFFSITWVVIGHQCSYSIQASQNIGDLIELSKPFYAQIVTNADLSVDTFFMLSGLLVTVALLRMVNETGRFNLFLYLFHRLLRLWPPIALSVLLVATVSGLTVTGPYAEQYQSIIVSGCRRSWWVDLSLTSNLIMRFNSHVSGETDRCLPHTWYLGVDTQLYLIMPLLLLPLVRWPRAGMAWLGAWTAASVIVPAGIVGAYHLWPASLLVNDPQAHLEYTYKLYLMPWCRAGPYFMGAWAGYLIYHGRSNPSITHLRLWQRFLGWGVAVGVALAVLFGITPYNIVGTPEQVPQMSTVEAVLYGGAHRAAWGAAVAWVIVACTWGYGGPVASILEYPFWQPLSRLTYCIYLTSLPIQFIVLYSTKRPTYYSYYLKVQETAGVMLVIVAVSIAVSLISESPVLSLEKMLLRRSTERQHRIPQETPTHCTPQHQHQHQQHQEENYENSLHINSNGTSITSSSDPVLTPS